MGEGEGTARLLCSSDSPCRRAFLRPHALVRSTRWRCNSAGLRPAKKRGSALQRQRRRVGDRSSWYCVLGETGEVLLEQKLGTTPKAMKEGFGGMPQSRIASETGMHSPGVSRCLSESGHEVIVAHARNARLIGESRRKDDRLDSQTWPGWQESIRNCWLR